MKKRSEQDCEKWRDMVTSATQFAYEKMEGKTASELSRFVHTLMQGDRKTDEADPEDKMAFLVGWRLAAAQHVIRTTLLGLLWSVPGVDVRGYVKAYVDHVVDAFEEADRKGELRRSLEDEQS